MPPKPEAMQWKCVEQDPQALGGIATRKQYELTFRADGSGPKLQMLVYLPNAVDSRSVPVITSLNFWGNHTVHSDPKIHLANAWIEQGNNPYCDLSGVQNHLATNACRGTNAAMWPIESLLRQGYAFSTIYRGDLVWDHPDNDLSGKMGDIFSLYPELQQTDHTLAASVPGLGDSVDNWMCLKANRASMFKTPSALVGRDWAKHRCWQV